MRNKRNWKRAVSAVLAAALAFPGPAVWAEEGQNAESKRGTVQESGYETGELAQESGYGTGEIEREFGGKAGELAREISSETGDFEINNGVLERYFGDAEEVEVPFGVTKIGYRAFYGCKKLKSVKLLHSVTRIGDAAFEGCSNLEKVYIPDTVERIDSLAFLNCSSLISITIPKEVTYISGNIFQGCSGLEEIKVEEGSSAYVSVDGCLYNKDQTEIISCPAAKTEVSLSDSLTKIGGSSFWKCSVLKEINLPDGVTEIYGNAFQGCSSLEKINIPAGMEFEYLSGGTFLGCSSLTEIAVSEGNPLYAGEGGCLYNKDKTKIIAYPGAKGMVTVPEGITEIGYGAFENGSNLTEITIPSSVNKIAIGVFAGCSSLQKIEVQEGSVTYASENGCLYNKDKTEILACPGGKTEITISPGVTKIGAYAFYHCANLPELDIPDSVETIEHHAFAECSSLTALHIPQNVSAIGECTFADCSNLTFISVSEESANYANDAQGCLYNLSKTEFHACPGSKTEVAIPDSVHTIKACAFACCRNLAKVTVPESVKVIGIEAFVDCDNLTIYGKSGSYAQTHAAELRVPFVATDGNISPIKKEISECRITISPESFVYDGAEKRPSVTVADGEVLLEENIDYTVSYQNNRDAGTGQVILTGIGGYTGTAEREFTITENPAGPSEPDKPDTDPVNPGETQDPGAGSVNPGKPQDPVKPENPDKDPVKPGVPTAGTSGEELSGNLTCEKTTYQKTYGDKPFSLNIALKDTRAVIACASSDKKVVSADHKGKVTIKGTGIAVITIQASAAGNYKAESVKVTVEVRPKKQAVKSLKTEKGRKLKVSWKKDKQASGYQLQYSTDKKFKKGVKSVSINKNKTAAKTIKKLKAGKRYYVRVRSFKNAKVNGGGKKLYGAWSKGKKSGRVRK